MLPVSLSSDCSPSETTIVADDFGMAFLDFKAKIVSPRSKTLEVTNLRLVLFELLQAFDGVTGVLELLAMLLLLARTIRTHTVSMISTLAHDIRGKRANIVVITARRVRLEFGVDRVIGESESKDYLPKFPFKSEGIHLGAVF